MLRPVVLCLAASSVCLLLCFSGCSDEEVNPLDVVNELGAPRSTRMYPGSLEERVHIDEEIRVVYDRLLEEVELDATVAAVNSERATILYTQGTTASYITIIPRTPLEYHQIYTVTVTPLENHGLPRRTWQFATEPGPAGLLWERIDAPVARDLYAVSLSSWGFIAGGEGGILLDSDYPIEWIGQYTIGIGGVPVTDDVREFWYAQNHLNAVVTGTGDILIGDYLGSWMRRWETDPDHYVNGMWGVTDVMCGSLRSDGTQGFIASSYPDTVTLTGTGRVMRAAHAGIGGSNYYRIAVGDEGSIFYVGDIQTWNWQDVSHQPAWGSFRAVTGGYSRAPDDTTSQNPPRPVAVGDNIAYSNNNGISWQLASTPPGVNLHTITYNGYPPENRTYVAAGDNGVILTAPDGRTWTSVDTGLDLTGVNFYGAWTDYPDWILVGSSGATVISPPNAIKLP